MSTEKIGKVISLVSAAATTAYHFGKRTATNPQKAGMCTSKGEPADGIIRNTITAALEPVGLMVDGISLIHLGSGGATTVNGKLALTTDANGNGIAATAGDSINGYALEDGAEGDHVACQYVEDAVKPVFGEATTNAKVVHVAVNGTTVHGGVQHWDNPEATDILVQNVVLRVTTIATAAAQLDVGETAVSNVTASDNLLDGIDVHSATGAFDYTDQLGANGKRYQVVPAGKWLTLSEGSGDLSAMVGVLEFTYIVTQP